MASFSYKGLDTVELSLQEIAKLPEPVVDEMLNAGADVLIPYQKSKATEMGVRDTGRLAESITKTAVKTQANGGRVVHVYAQGSRKRGRKSTRNAEIHFVNEFGKKGQAARPFTKVANEAAGEAVTEAEAAVYDRWLSEN